MDPKFVWNPSEQAEAGPHAPWGDHEPILRSPAARPTYRDHPLFGKYTGTIWVPDHLRGQIRDGVVLKDYLVTAEEPALT